jgi:hypothetical protein
MVGHFLLEKVDSFDPIEYYLCNSAPDTIEELIQTASTCVEAQEYLSCHILILC